VDPQDYHGSACVKGVGLLGVAGLAQLPEGHDIGMTGLASDDIWRHCNICKAGIGFGAEYFVCSVSTCNRKRTGLNFCGLPCFEAHLPTARHRDAWAESQRAPSRAEWQAALQSGASDDVSDEVRPAQSPPAATRSRVVTASAGAEPDATDVLVVVSKLKKYVKDWSGMNTSDSVSSVLSEHLRELCREATRQAGLDGRRTVLDRDFTKVLQQRRESGR
jgi:histone H3/H4